jgi:dUTPase.
MDKISDLNELSPEVTLMNDEKELAEKRTIDELFAEQESFMYLLQQKRNFPAFPVDLKTKEGQRVVKDIGNDCIHELFEAVHLLTDAKQHRQTIVGGFDKDAFLEELVDALHYLIEICIMIGVTPRELYKAYENKGKINENRIRNGY